MLLVYIYPHCQVRSCCPLPFILRIAVLLPFVSIILYLSFASVYLFVSVPETTGHDFVLITVRGTVKDV